MLPQSPERKALWFTLYCDLAPLVETLAFQRLRHALPFNNWRRRHILRLTREGKYFHHQFLEQQQIRRVLYRRSSGRAPILSISRRPLGRFGVRFPKNVALSLSPSLSLSLSLSLRVRSHKKASNGAAVMRIPIP